MNNKTLIFHKKMDSENYYTIDSFSITTADERDYRAYTSIPNDRSKEFKFTNFFIILYKSWLKI